MARIGLEAPTGLVAASIDCGGLPRTYQLSLPATRPAPLLMVLHGAGSTGLGTAALTGLAQRGTAAGFAVVFPDGWHHVWNDRRGTDGLSPSVARRAFVNDVGFLQALLDRLVSEGVAEPDGAAVAGISNGAFMAEHLAREALLPIGGIGLVAGAATETSRQLEPRPVRPCTVVMFAGTGDPLVPYQGGPLGPLGRLVARRTRATSYGGAPRGIAVGAEVVAADWVAANGLPADPVVEQLPSPAGDLTVLRYTWRSPGRPPVVLHRIEGGGHTWPGAAQYLPARMIGPVARGLDATGVILMMLAPP